MKLNCILTACNLNAYYLGFIPIFIRSWQKVLPHIQVKVILIADEIPSSLLKYRSFIELFPPIDQVSTAFTSQYIRILYPALLPFEGAVLISDVDMLPMSGGYYTENIHAIPETHFVYLRDVLLNEREIAICYAAANPSTWAEIFQIYTISDIRERLTCVNQELEYEDTHGGSGWNKDQRDLYDYVTRWHAQTNRFTHLNDTDTGFRRLDGKLPSGKRGFNIVIQQLKFATQVMRGQYTDFHARGPNEKFRWYNEFMTRLRK